MIDSLPVGVSLEEFASSGVDVRDISILIARTITQTARDRVGSLNALDKHWGIYGDGRDENAALQAFLNAARDAGVPTVWPAASVAYCSEEDLYFYTPAIFETGALLRFSYTGSDNYKSRLVIAADDVCIEGMRVSQDMAQRFTVTASSGSGTNLVTYTIAETFPSWFNGKSIAVFGLTPNNHNCSGRTATVTGTHTFTVSQTCTNGNGVVGTRGAFCQVSRNNTKPLIATASGITGMNIHHCVLAQSVGAGMLLQGISDYRVQDNEIRNTRADAIIHLTSTINNVGGCTKGIVSGNKIKGTGDDAISVVGEFDAPTLHEHIDIVGNKVSDGWDYDDTTGAAQWGSGGGLRVVGARHIKLIENSQYDCFGGILIGYDSGTGTAGVDDVQLVNHTSDTVGNVSASMGAVRVIGNSTYKAKNVKVIGGNFSNVRYRAIFASGGSVGDIQNFSVVGATLYNTGALDDADGATGSQASITLQHTQNPTLKDLDIIETGGLPISVTSSVSGKVVVDNIYLESVNRNGAASTDGMTITASADADLYEIGTFTHRTQVGLGGTYTMERLIELASFTNTSDPRVVWKGRQFSVAASGVTTLIPSGVGGANGAINGDGQILFRSGAINLASAGDNALDCQALLNGTQVWGNWQITKVTLVYQTGAFNTDCQVEIRDAASGGGNLIAKTTATGAATEVRFMNAANEMAILPLDTGSTGALFNRLTDTTLFARVTTPNGAAFTAAVVIYGKPG